MIAVTLRGGSRDGERFLRPANGARVLIVPARVSMEESESLRISDAVAWKAPEDVYELQNGEWVYVKTHHFKP